MKLDQSDFLSQTDLHKPFPFVASSLQVGITKKKNYIVHNCSSGIVDSGSGSHGVFSPIHNGLIIVYVVSFFSLLFPFGYGMML